MGLTTCMNNSKKEEAATSLYPTVIHYLAVFPEGLGKLANNCPELCECVCVCACAHTRMH
jgi:hypothetical protein